MISHVLPNTRAKNKSEWCMTTNRQKVFKRTQISMSSFFFWSNLNNTWLFIKFLLESQIQNWTKIRCQAEAKRFRADNRTDWHEKVNNRHSLLFCKHVLKVGRWRQIEWHHGHIKCLEYSSTDSNDTKWQAGRQAGTGSTPDHHCRYDNLCTKRFQGQVLCIPTWQGLSIVVLVTQSLVVSKCQLRDAASLNCYQSLFFFLILLVPSNSATKSVTFTRFLMTELLRSNLT